MCRCQHLIVAALWFVAPDPEPVKPGMELDGGREARLGVSIICRSRGGSIAPVRERLVGETLLLGHS
jgi:hypothetical protein